MTNPLLRQEQDMTHHHSESIFPAIDKQQALITMALNDDHAKALHIPPDISPFLARGIALSRAENCPIALPADLDLEIALQFVEHSPKNALLLYLDEKTPLKHVEAIVSRLKPGQGWTLILDPSCNKDTESSLGFPEKFVAAISRLRPGTYITVSLMDLEFLEPSNQQSILSAMNQLPAGCNAIFEYSDTSSGGLTPSDRANTALILATMISAIKNPGTHITVHPWDSDDNQWSHNGAENIGSKVQPGVSISFQDISQKFLLSAAGTLQEGAALKLSTTRSLSEILELIGALRSGTTLILDAETPDSIVQDKGLLGRIAEKRILLKRGDKTIDRSSLAAATSSSSSSLSCSYSTLATHSLSQSSRSLTYDDNSGATRDSKNTPPSHTGLPCPCCRREYKNEEGDNPINSLSTNTTLASLVTTVIKSDSKLTKEQYFSNKLLLSVLNSDNKPQLEKLLKRLLEEENLLNSEEGPDQGISPLCLLIGNTTGLAILHTRTGERLLKLVTQKGLEAPITSKGPSQGASPLLGLMATFDGLAILQTPAGEHLLELVTQKGLEAPITGEGPHQGTSPLFWLTKTAAGLAFLQTPSGQGLLGLVTQRGLEAPVTGNGSNQGTSALYWLAKSTEGQAVLKTPAGQRLLGLVKQKGLESLVTDDGPYRDVSALYWLVLSTEGQTVLKTPAGQRLLGLVTQEGLEAGNRSPFYFLICSATGRDVLSSPAGLNLLKLISPKGFNNAYEELESNTKELKAFISWLDTLEDTKALIQRFPFLAKLIKFQKLEASLSTIGFMAELGTESSALSTDEPELFMAELRTESLALSTDEQETQTEESGEMPHVLACSSSFHQAGRKRKDQRDHGAGDKQAKHTSQSPLSPH